MGQAAEGWDQPSYAPAGSGAETGRALPDARPWRPPSAPRSHHQAMRVRRSSPSRLGAACSSRTLCGTRGHAARGGRNFVPLHHCSAQLAHSRSRPAHVKRSVSETATRTRGEHPLCRRQRTSRPCRGGSMRRRPAPRGAPEPPCRTRFRRAKGASATQRPDLHCFQRPLTAHGER